MVDRPPSRIGGELAVLGGVFLVSGISALIYQVSWQRILALHSGVGIYSVAMIVAAFLAGLGIGSWLGGAASARLRPLAALRAFAAVELGVAVLGAASCWIYYDLLYLRLPGLFANPWLAGGVHFALLVGPTTLMGMSLPLLVRAAVHDVGRASSTIGYLYGINVLGAALGAILAPWFLIPYTGIRGAVWIAAAGNALAGASVLLLSRSAARASDSPQGGEIAPPPPAPGIEPAGSQPFGLWLGLYTLSGFCALSLEILWFRLVDVGVKSTAFTFGTVLSVYLFGLGLGSVVGGPLAARLARPLRAFLACQCALLTYSGLAVTLLVALPHDWPVLSRLFGHWQQAEEFQIGGGASLGLTLLLYLVLPLGLYGVPTVLMGLSFGILQRAVQVDPQTSGFKVGILQAGNIVGNVLGSLVAGLVLLEVLGTAGALRTIVAIGLVFAGIGLRNYGVRSIFAPLAAVLAVVVVLMPGGYGLWLRLHGLSEPSGLFAEDAAAVSAITPDPGSLRVSLNGKSQSWLPFAGIHTQLGALPALVHPAPRRAAIIGLGSGDTAWASGLRAETEHLEIWEISPAQLQLLEATARQADLPKLQSFLRDPRVRVTIGDGRNALAVGGESWDLIEADALRPTSAFSGNLYSVEFFQLCASRLAEGGLMCSWIPTPRAYRSFCAAFPHAVEFLGGQVLIGSRDPITIDVPAWLARLEDASVLDYLGPEAAEVVRLALPSARIAAPELYLDRAPNRDLFPGDEFRSPPWPRLAAWVGATDSRPSISDTGPEGSWLRQDAETRSAISILRGPDGFHFGWSRSSGADQTRCTTGSRCLMTRHGRPYLEFRFRAFQREGSPDLFVEGVGTAAPGADAEPVQYVDRLVVEPGGEVLSSWLIEADGEPVATPSKSLTFRKVSDEPF